MLHHSRAEEPEPAADVQGVASLERLGPEEIVDEHLDAAAGVVMRQRALERVGPEPIVGELACGHVALLHEDAPGARGGGSRSSARTPGFPACLSR